MHFLKCWMGCLVVGKQSMKLKKRVKMRAFDSEKFWLMFTKKLVFRVSSWWMNMTNLLLMC